MLEIKTLISNILLKYELIAITKVEDVVFLADIVLRTTTPMLIHFKQR